MLLSAPMIVKNEAANLGACLKSVCAVADEVLVLDTGSTDDTVAIAKQYTAQVYQSERFTAETRPEDFHFAEARNEILVRCAGEWVLSVDADERVVQSGLRDTLTTLDSPSVLVALRIMKRPGRTAYVPRLFRNGREMQWAGRYHDVPQPWDHKTTLRLSADTCCLENHGGDDRAKQLRNLVLLKRQAAEEPRAGYTTLQIADAYRMLGVLHFPEALGHYELCLAAFGKHERADRAYILFVMADCWSRLGMGAKAIQLCHQLMIEFPNYERGPLVMAETYQRLKQYDLAIAYYRRASLIDDPMPLHPCFEETIDREAVEQRIMLCDRMLREQGTETNESDY